MFGVDFFEKMAEATNVNATVKSPPPPERANTPLATSDAVWHPTTGKEMMAFVAINVLMGIKVQPEYRNYWSNDDALHDNFVAGMMTRNRFEKLCKYHHCALPADEDRADRLTKVRPLIALCQQNFAFVFDPHRDLSVDEAMIAFNGRLSWKQYMPKKPVKWGIKLWCLCDANTGYCVAFRVYTGTEVDAPHLNLDLGYRVTMDLMDSHLQRHHHLFADNFFTSVHLANDLLQAGTYLCGTTRATRREFPKTVAHAPLRPGESVKWTDESGVMVCKWKDKRYVYLIATNDAGGDVVKHVRRKHRDVDLTVPTCVLA